MAIIFDHRDWHERGDDPTPQVEQLMQLWWELGLDSDIKLVASKRLYDRVQGTDFGNLVLDRTKPSQHTSKGDSNA